MILALDTSTPTCRMYLLDSKNKLAATKDWLAERRLAKELLEHLEAFLHDNQTNFSNLKGLIVFKGPGSFTGLRIGITVMDTLALALDIPIVGTAKNEWLEKGCKKLAAGQNQKIVLPEYGAQPHITVPKK